MWYVLVRDHRGKMAFRYSVRSTWRDGLLRVSEAESPGVEYGA
jgi:hypothetical protein